MNRVEARKAASQSCGLEHQDPFDRMLIAQAISEPLHLLFHDKNASFYSESIMRV
jgi:PIN domain nuclease of toxin-antitoxin system